MRSQADIGIDMELLVRELLQDHGYEFPLKAYASKKMWAATTQILQIWVDGFEQDAWKFLAGATPEDDFIDIIMQALDELPPLLDEEDLYVCEYELGKIELVEKFVKDLKLWSLSNYAFNVSKEGVKREQA